MLEEERPAAFHLFSRGSRYKWIFFDSVESMLGIKIVQRLFPSVKPEPRALAGGKLGICVPAINSAPYIDLMLQHYERIGVPVTVFVDEKTTDRTLSAVKRAGFQAETIANPSSRVAHFIGEMSARMRTPWVLRFDDDELPTRRMIEFAEAVVERDDIDAIAFWRYQCAVDLEGQLAYHLKHDASIYHQWRLYRPAKVTFTDRGHTPGFELSDDLVKEKAPSDAFMVHLDWVVHTPEQRREKIARYDAHTPNHGSAWRHYYLPEELPDFQNHFRLLPSNDFSEVGQALMARFPARW